MSRVRTTAFPRTLLVIEGDTNDADYISETTDVTDKSPEFMARIRLVAAAVKANGGEWPAFEFRDKTLEEAYPDLDPEDLEVFGSYCPNGEHGIHSIESVKILVVSSEEVLV